MMTDDSIRAAAVIATVVALEGATAEQLKAIAAVLGIDRADLDVRLRYCPGSSFEFAVVDALRTERRFHELAGQVAR